MSYAALYRKFRPERFEDVKGQPHIVTTLTNQIKADRIGHAYLFCGTRGTGKTSVAKIFARAVNCAHPVGQSPCGECAMCRAISAGASMNVFEIDAASNNGVDNIREIREGVSYPPTEGKYKVYIIDEVHMLSTGAFNALLKTLEEPPSYVIFILATTEVHKIPATIMSRCQRYDFKRISVDTITGHMRDLLAQEQLGAEDKALTYIAKTADGSMRDALSLLEQCISYHFGKTLTYEMTLEVLGAVDTEVFWKLMQSVIAGDVAKAVGVVEEVIVQGRELSQFVTDLTWYLRNLLLLQISDEAEDVMDVSREHLDSMREQALQVDAGALIRYIRVLSELSDRLRGSAQKRVLVEIAIVKLCKPQMEQSLLDLQERVRQLEHKLESGQFTAAPQQEAPPETVDKKQKEETQEAPPVPAAIPEEVEEVVKNWNALCMKMPEPQRIVYPKATLSLDGENRLLLVFDNEYSPWYDMVKNEVENGDLDRLIEKQIGRRVKCSVRFLKAGKRAKDAYPDLQSLIHMPIVEEDI